MIQSLWEKIGPIILSEIDPFLVYLFGSVSKGSIHPDSDIDLAFISDKDISSYELFMIAQQLADVMKREIDLIDLRKARTVMRAQVVGTGTILLDKDPTRRQWFQMRAFKEYALLNEERQVIFNRIHERGTIYDA